MLRKSAAFSLLDQLISAAGLFLFSSLISKSLGAEEFGHFSVLLAWASLLSALLQPALIDSSTVMNARREDGNSDWGLVAVQISLRTVLGAGTIACLIWLVGAESTIISWGVLIASELSVSLLALLRRTGYATGPLWLGVAMSCSNAALTVLIIPLCMIGGHDAIHAIYARAIINATTVLPAAVWYLKGAPRPPLHQILIKLRKLLHFSRAYIGGSAIFWLTNSLQIVLIGYTLSMADAAGYRVAQLLVLPMAQIQTAIYQIAMPNVVQRAQSTTFDTQRELMKLGVIFLLPALGYACLVALSAHWLLPTIFGPSFASFQTVVIAMSGVAVLEALKQVAVIMIYALNHQSLFMRYRVWSLALFVMGIAPALWWGNLMAFVIASATTNLILLCMLGSQLMKITRTKELPA